MISRTNAHSHLAGHWVSRFRCRQWSGQEPDPVALSWNMGPLYRSSKALTSRVKVPLQEWLKRKRPVLSFLKFTWYPMMATLASFRNSSRFCHAKLQLGQTLKAVILIPDSPHRCRSRGIKTVAKNRHDHCRLFAALVRARVASATYGGAESGNGATLLTLISQRT